MKVYFTLEASPEVIEKLGLIHDQRIEDFFETRSYSEDLEVLYIAVSCMSPKFEPLFKLRKPKYTSENKVYIHKGVQVEKKARSFEYELRLDYSRYNSLNEIGSQLSKDIIASLDTIHSCKQIKNLNIDRFKEDFSQLFKVLKWIE